MIFCLNATKNWYLYLQIVVYSLLSQNNVRKVILVIEDDKIENLKDDRIEFININKIPNYVNIDSPNYNTYFTKMSFVRIYLSKIVNYDKVYYLDTDTIVDGNIEELEKINVDYIAGVKEKGKWDNHLCLKGFDGKYINSGFLIMNLKNIKKNKLDDLMIDLLNKNKYTYPDQDIINIVFKDKILYLDSTYNNTKTTGLVEKPKIIHYIGREKGWVDRTFRSNYYKKWFNKFIESKENMGKDFKVKAIINFDDLKDKCRRNINDIFFVDKERFEFLLSHKSVELIEIIEEVKKAKKTKKK